MVRVQVIPDRPAGSRATITTKAPAMLDPPVGKSVGQAVAECGAALEPDMRVHRDPTWMHAIEQRGQRLGSQVPQAMPGLRTFGN